MIEIEAQHFYSVLGVRNGVVVEAAPNVAWMQGKSMREVKTYCRRKGWRATNHEVFSKQEAAVDR